MALMTENRNRIPLVATAPVSGSTPGKVGDMRMVASGSPLTGDGVIHICTVAGEADSGSPFTSTSVWVTNS